MRTSKLSTIEGSLFFEVPNQVVKHNFTTETPGGAA